MATLSIVGTPIGNLEDVTLRALKALAAADTILCEDTRVTKRLLGRHGIDRPTLSYHAHSGAARADLAVAMLREGKSLALVSDAGTPGISDPGAELVARVRRELAGELADGRLKIEAVPGPSALTAALSVAGVPCADFTFFGFLPHKKGRETLFKEIAAMERTAVFYESPHRLMKALGSLVEHIGPAPKRVTVCRELTKVFEEVVAGTAAEARAYFAAAPGKVRGELAIIVSAAGKPDKAGE
ncbi:MAG: 16S rRNA (cytidine(1402)-2'-O)-methyltransferase [Patescibacteria group bacterium]|nr:16S rRNA (cytidine(1402)-2'-O)-methyltransferase [Patescibacteria group bacterium]